MKKRKNATRIIAIVLVLLMALALIPFAASAEGEITVTYHGNGGFTADKKETYQVVKTAGVSFKLENPFLYPHHTLVEWERTDPDITTTSFKPSDTVKFSKNANLVAHWEEDPQYTVTFNANGGSGTMVPVTDYAGESVSIANAFTAPAGCSFAGWATSPTGAVAYTAGTLTLSADLNLYAVWSYSITLNGGGGTIDGQATKTVTAQAPLTLPTSGLSYAGHSFSHWVNESLEPVTAVTCADAGKTFTSVWADDSIYVSYSGGSATGGSAPTAPAPGLYLRGSGFSLPACTYTYPNHLFTGWKIGTSATVQQPSAQLDWTAVPAGAAEVELIAQWEPTITISYDPDGGTPTPEADVIPQSGSITSLPTVAKSGFVFQGWFDNDTKVTATEASPYSPGYNKNLKAKWLSENVTFKFLPGGGTGTMADGTASRSAGKYTLPTSGTFAKPTGKCLSGWRIGGTDYALGADYAINSSTPDEVAVTALWADERKVTFDANGGTPATTEVYVPDGGKVPSSSFPAVTKDGYALVGWFVGEAAFTSDTAVTANTTVTARWLSNTVEVTLNPNGGTGTAKTQTMSRVTAIKLMPFSETGFTAPSGRVFKGWDRNAAATAPHFTDAMSVKWDGNSEFQTDAPADGKVTLYAVWEEKLSGTVTIGRGEVASITDPKVNDTLKAVPVVTPTDATLYYRWKLDGAAISGATAATYTVKASDYGKKISVEVSNDPNFAYLIKSSALTVGADEQDLSTLTVVFSGSPDGFSVKVNDTAVTGGSTVKVAKGGTVKVTLEPGASSKYVSQLQLGPTTIKDKNVAAVNSIKVPNTDTCTLTVTFADKTGKTPTATIDPNANVSEALAAFTEKARSTLPAGYKDRCKVNAFDVVACWDNKVTNTLDPADMPADGLTFTLPYPAGSEYNAKVAANMPGYYTVTVYHYEGGVAKPITNITANKTFGAGVTVKGQKSFSGFGVALTPPALDGKVNISGTNSGGKTASVGAELTAAYSKTMTGKPAYQWQIKAKSAGADAWTDISGATKANYTPKSGDLGKVLRCVMSSDFETGEVASDAVEIVNKPNPKVIQYVIRGHNPVDGRVGNVTSDMEWTGPSASTPSSTAVWHSISGAATTFPAAAGGKYWVRIKDDETSGNWSSVTVPLYYTVTGMPGDSVSANRVYFSATAASGSGVLTRIANKEWLVPAGKSINVTANSANTKYYKIVKLAKENVDTGEVKVKSVNKANSASTGNITVNDPYVIYAWAGVYGAKTGDASHLNLWIELAVLSLMGLSAAVVFGRRKLKKQ